MTADLPFGPHTVQPLRPEDWDEWYRCLETAFGGQEEPPEERALWRGLTEFDRSLAVRDGSEVVGCAGAFSFRLSVPGGAVLPAAGVTMVGVLPTHRRRGLLTALMRHQLDDVRARGEALAVLGASEPVIYGRFGYGQATWRAALSVPSRRVTLPHSPGPGVRLRLVDPAAAVPACEEVYAALVPLRPGMLERRPGWERLGVTDAPGSRDGFSPLQCVLAEDAATGRPLGYARYAVRTSWEGDVPGGEAKVRDVQALTPQVYARLWAYLLELDLVDTVTLYSRPVDDPVLHLLSDVRRVRPTLGDALFVRLVEVGAALAGRGYLAPVSVVFEVADEFCPWNAGRWRLRCAGPGKAVSCERTEDAADLALSVRELGAAYLGGVSLAALAGAGRVTELRPGALAEASRAFGSDLAPWLPHGF
ncbi:GNAT family N-acetyltransferase [Kitasatospora sp. NPDC002227]|uniref:GNAT family N-acetyltransferase n=1 Tax=Kitasatospora sp. NPDC002227 TaxID=3154773 RepID=UPI0033295E45